MALFVALNGSDLGTKWPYSEGSLGTKWPCIGMPKVP